MKKIVIGAAVLFAATACGTPAQAPPSTPAAPVAVPVIPETARAMEERLFPGLDYTVLWRGPVCELQLHPDQPTLDAVITYHWNGGSLAYPQVTFAQFATLWKLTANDCAGYVEPTY